MSIPPPGAPDGAGTTGSRGEPSPEPPWASLAGEAFCYLTTTGRLTGRSHTIEIWFALDGTTLYMLSGGGRRSDWVRNLIRTPEVAVRIGHRLLDGRARIVTDPSEDERARRLVHAKYQASYAGDLSGWRRSSLPVAVDLTAEAG